MSNTTKKTEKKPTATKKRPAEMMAVSFYDAGDTDVYISEEAYGVMVKAEKTRKAMAEMAIGAKLTDIVAVQVVGEETTRVFPNAMKVDGGVVLILPTDKWGKAEDEPTDPSTYSRFLKV